MELWQFNACINAYNERKQAEDKQKLFFAWCTANWTGAAFAGKLRKFSNYVKEEQTEPVERGSALTREQMDEFDRRLKEKREAAYAAV
jgi:hypothetical protein